MLEIWFQRIKFEINPVGPRRRGSKPPFGHCFAHATSLTDSSGMRLNMDNASRRQTKSSSNNKPAREEHRKKCNGTAKLDAHWPTTRGQQQVRVLCSFRSRQSNILVNIWCLDKVRASRFWASQVLIEMGTR